MKFEKVKWIFATSVNVAVLISVILLLFELKQNQDIAIAQTRNEISMQAREQSMFMASDDIAIILIKNRNGEQLSELEQFKLGQVSNINLELLENIVYQYENGMYSDDEFEVIADSFSRMSQRNWDFFWNNPDAWSRSFSELMFEARTKRENDI